MSRGGGPTGEPADGSAGAVTAGTRRARSPLLGLATRENHRPLAAERAGLFLDQAAAVFITLGTVAAAASAWPRAESVAARVQPLAVVAAQTACVLFLFTHPQAYIRHRAWLAPLLRIGPACMPPVRKMGLGPALILERPAQAGAAGALLDLLRMLLGTRVIAAFCAGIGAMLPPLSALLSQTAVTLLLMNSREACQTEMLRHPLTRGRMATAAAVLDALSLPLVAFQPALPLPWRQLGGDALCQASVRTLMVTTGVVLPVLASALCWQPAQQRGQCPQQQHVLPDEREGGEPQGRGRWAAVRGKLGGAVTTADAALHRACGGRLPAHARLAVLWLCIAATWLLSKQLPGSL